MQDLKDFEDLVNNLEKDKTATSRGAGQLKDKILRAEWDTVEDREMVQALLFRLYLLRLRIDGAIKDAGD